MSERVCAVCGADQYRKKVWTKRYAGTRREQVICMACGYKGYRFWPDGSTYNTKEGLTPEQRESMRLARARAEKEGA